MSVSRSDIDYSLLSPSVFCIQVLDNVFFFFFLSKARTYQSVEGMTDQKWGKDYEALTLLNEGYDFLSKTKKALYGFYKRLKTLQLYIYLVLLPQNILFFS